MPTCFVIMPVSTPETLVSHYGKDAEHFSHVLKHLFVPAIRKAAFDPILPIAQGADVIHAEIIKNLETADLVLCDISALNPNVFFELGCRTALNKPVCYVMDDLTRGIPFDTGIINHHTYSSELAPWTLDGELERLSAHIRSSAERSGGKNMLWQYFGLRSTAHAAVSEGDEQDRIAYLVMQMDAIRKHLEDQVTYTALPYPFEPVEVPTSKISWTMPARVNANIFDLTTRDWDAVVADAENDLKQIAILQKQSEKPPDLDAVKGLIQGHIKSLEELIDSERQTYRATQALEILRRYKNLLYGKPKS